MSSPEYDVVIVGSGAGGGTIAKRLAPLIEKGLRVALLESGPRYDRTYFNQREADMQSLFWEGGAWLNPEGTLQMVAGRMLGGSTPVYTGVTFKLPDDVCREWNVPTLTVEDLAPRFSRLKEEVGAAELPPERINKNNELFAAGAEACGMKTIKLEINVRGCKGYGFCNLGCASGAKQSTLEVQIPSAEEAGLEVIHNCHVRRVEDGRVHAEVLRAPEGSTPNERPEGKISLSARFIVVSAGACSTPALLAASQLPNMSPTLGRFFTVHPSLTVNGTHPEIVDSHLNFPKAYYVDDFSKSHDVYLETAFYYPGVTAKNIDGFGVEHLRRMKKYRHMMAIILLNHDAATYENRVAAEPGTGRPVLEYQLSEASIRSLVQGQREAARVFFAAGCTEVYVPSAPDGMITRDQKDDIDQLVTVERYQKGRIISSSAHPQGGCRMGTDASDSVCDPYGVVHGQPWLRVADASLFPKSSHVNPYLTVMALSDRVADRLIDDLA